MFKRNAKRIVFFVLIIGTVFGYSLGALAAEDDSLEVANDKVNEAVDDQEEVKKILDARVDKMEYHNDYSFYEQAYANATKEQKEEIDRILTDKSMGFGVQVRDIRIALGELPRNTPRLTATQAAELYDSKDISELERELNKIAGAPDFYGGSGHTYAIYYLNEEGTDTICIDDWFAFHIVFNEDGTQTELPLGNKGKAYMESLSKIGPTQPPLVNQN